MGALGVFVRFVVFCGRDAKNLFVISGFPRPRQKMRLKTRTCLPSLSRLLERMPRQGRERGGGLA